MVFKVVSVKFLIYNSDMDLETRLYDINTYTNSDMSSDMDLRLNVIYTFITLCLYEKIYPYVARFLLQWHLRCGQYLLLRNSHIR